MSYTKGSPVVTPTFSGVLNHNLILLTDCLNKGDLYGAFDRIETVISMLKEEDREEILGNDVAHIKKNLGICRRLEGTDSFQTGLIQNNCQNAILRKNIMPLFRKLMMLLHDKGYLEKKPLQPKRPSSKHLGWK